MVAAGGVWRGKSKPHVFLTNWASVLCQQFQKLLNSASRTTRTAAGAGREAPAALGTVARLAVPLNQSLHLGWEDSGLELRSGVKPLVLGWKPERGFCRKPSGLV